jgi:hypothetical protein
LRTCFALKTLDAIAIAAETIPFVFTDSIQMQGACNFAKDYGLSTTVAALQKPWGKHLWGLVNELHLQGTGTGKADARQVWCVALGRRALGNGAPLAPQAFDFLGCSKK